MTPTAVKNSHTIDRFVPGGQVFFNPLVNGAYQGEFYLGNTSTFDVSVKTTTITIYTSEFGPLEIEMEIPQQIERTADLSCKQVAWNQLKWFYIGDLNELTQTSGTVTGENLTVIPDRYYQLGVTSENPTGVREISAASVTRSTTTAAATAAAAAQTEHAYSLGDIVHPAIANQHYYECTAAGTSGVSAPTWKTDGTDTTDGTVTWKDLGALAFHAAKVSTAYVLGDLVQPATANGHFYECAVAGTSGGTAPTWKTDKTTFTDGTVTWIDRGVAVLSLTTDYTIDTELARLYTVPTGGISDDGEDVEVTYTKSATTRMQIEASSIATVKGQLKYISVPANGEPRDLFASNVTLIPNGKITLKSAKPDAVDISWTVSFARGPNGEPPLFIDGRPV
jgi:hypothetical protein